MFPIKDTVPGRSPPVVTGLLIGFNAVVFFFELTLSPGELERFVYMFGLVPARYSHPAWARFMGLSIDNYWPFVTSMFLHGGWLHFLGNMWYLWLFGDNVEDRMGHGRFLLFYLLCGFVANLVHWRMNLTSTVPALGASGAISGVMGAYALLFPLARIITLVPIFFYPVFFEIHAYFFIVFWFWMQLFSGTLAAIVPPNGGGGVAWWAHVGGFVAGVLFYRFFLRPAPERRRLHPDEHGWHAAWSGFRY